MSRSQRSKVLIHGSLYGAPPGSSWGGTDPEPPVALTLSGIAPATAEAGALDTTITLTGTGFDASCSVLLDGAAVAPPTVVDATSMTAVIPAASLAAAAAIAVTVSNGTETTNPVTFDVTAPAAAPAPSLTTLEPATAVIGGADFTLTINGADLVAGLSVFFDGLAVVPVTFVSAAQVTVPIVMAAQTEGNKSVYVQNPDLQESAPLSFTMTAAAGDATATKAKKKR
jgi:hypothetical protein